MVYISLGSNLGNRINNLRTASNILIERYLHNSVFSIVIETEPILPKNSVPSWNKNFLNMIIAGDSKISPSELIVALKSIEFKMGRSKTYKRWSPRIIDLDILIWEGFEIKSPQLVIPHPELTNRPFLHHLLALMGVKAWQHNNNQGLFKKSFILNPQFVGVVNVTNDSFSDGGHFNQTDKAITQILKLSSDGASVIEIGAQSTRPGATINNASKEYANLKPILDGITELIDKKNIAISIDTFQPLVARKILENYSISMVNDVKGQYNKDILKQIAEKKCRLCLMHSLGIPPTKELIISPQKKAINVIKDWGKKAIDRLISCGFSPDQIILDPGIGFGKSMYQSIEILQNIKELKDLGIKVMIGHSRKSYINAFSQAIAFNRDIETIAISSILKGKVDFLRVHNVEDHMKFLVAHEIFNV